MEHSTAGGRAHAVLSPIIGEEDISLFSVFLPDMQIRGMPLCTDAIGVLTQVTLPVDEGSLESASSELEEMMVSVLHKARYQETMADLFYVTISFPEGAIGFTEEVHTDQLAHDALFKILSNMVQGKDGMRCAVLKPSEIRDLDSYWRDSDYSYTLVGIAGSSLKGGWYP